MHPVAQAILETRKSPLEPGREDGGGAAGSEAVTIQLTPEREERWPKLGTEAYHGLIGEFVRAVEPHSEADPVGILLHTLVAAGCLIGSSPHCLVEYYKHPARLNLLLIGRTSGGRKGTAWTTPRYLFSQMDEEWTRNRIKSGLSSGEGLIYQVRDGADSDPGESDKRLLLIEQEFASAFKAMEREGNTLSPKIRDAWDHGTLTPLTRRERMKATDAHICVVGHITREELERSLTMTERANGFANRFLMAMVRKSKDIASGNGIPTEQLQPFIERFSSVLTDARTRQTIRRDTDAETLWASVYPSLNQETIGLAGAILNRRPAQVLRVSLIYSLLDEREIGHSSPAIRVSHLRAALAVMDYCVASAKFIFGDATGDPDADRMLRLLTDGPKTDTQLYESFGKHGSTRKDHAADVLTRYQRAHAVRITETGGRPVTEWHLGPQAHCIQENCAKSALRGG